MVVYPDLPVQSHPAAVLDSSKPVQDTSSEPTIRRREGGPSLTNDPGPGGRRGTRIGGTRVGELRIGTTRGGGIGDPSGRTGSLDREPAPSRGRAVTAARRPWLAEGRSEVHHGMRPGGGSLGRHRRVGDGLETGRRNDTGRSADDPAEDSPHVHVHGPHRDPVRQGGNGSGRVRADTGQCLEFDDG